MSQLSKDEVKKIAQLARLKLSDEEIARYQVSLGRVLDAFKSLDQVATHELREHRSERAAQGLDVTSDATSRMRADVVDNSISTQTFIEQAPSREGVYLRVPAILDKEG